MRQSNLCFLFPGVTQKHTRDITTEASRQCEMEIRKRETIRPGLASGHHLTETGKRKTQKGPRFPSVKFPLLPTHILGVGIVGNSCKLCIFKESRHFPLSLIIIISIPPPLLFSKYVCSVCWHNTSVLYIDEAFILGASGRGKTRHL